MQWAYAGEDTHASGIVQHLCRCTEIPRKDREELIDSLICALLLTSLQTRDKRAQQAGFQYP